VASIYNFVFSTLLLKDERNMHFVHGNFKEFILKLLDAILLEPIHVDHKTNKLFHLFHSASVEMRIAGGASPHSRAAISRVRRFTQQHSQFPPGDYRRRKRTKIRREQIRS